MYLIYLASTLLFIWISIAGVTVTSHRYLSDIAIARSIGLLLVALLLFFVEHFIGLGKLYWVLPIAVIFGGWMVYKHHKNAPAGEFWKSERVFVLAFLYGFFWRYSFPAISPSSEKITDLFFISNYYPGDALPPLDNWNPPHLFDYYYAFQHYAAALLGRVFNLEIGTCYNLSFALIAALPLTLAWSASGHYIKKKSLRILLVATLAFGGTGFSPILHLTLDAPNRPETEDKSKWVQYKHAMGEYSRQNIISSVRFIGRDMDPRFQKESRPEKSTTKGVSAKNNNKESKKPLVLPSENFGYQFFLGDYHPTMGGFFLLLLAVALIIHFENGRQPRLSQGLLAVCVPMMLITNTWTFPLIVLLISGWLAFRVLYRMPVDWPVLIGAGLAGTLLIYPFLAGFAANSLATPIKFVTGDLHTPVSRFIGMHWHVLLLLGFGLFDKKYRRLSLTLSVTWLALLLITEFFYIDDLTAAKYERTNSVMKWWGWIQTGVVVTHGTLCLGSSKKWIRWATVALFITINISALDLARYWYYSGRYSQGKLAGHNWYTENATNRMMFEFMKEAPKGVVLESISKNAYCNTSMYSIFNDKPVLLGWPSHLHTWHGKIPRIWILKSEIDTFYKGEMDNTLGWLESNNVDYIVFSPKDNDANFKKIDNQINRAYVWHEYNQSRKRHTGIWVKTSIDSHPDK
ncbi:MAG: DUF2298 domain-containing protein [Desulfobacteraceae bacterium]|jgi:hypothetical protein